MENETIADIVAEYRADADKMDCGELYQPTTIYIRQLLNRIETAWKRETQTYLDQIRDAMNQFGHEKFKAEHSPVGNAAAMREALIAVSKAFDDSLICTDSQMSMGECDRLDDVYHKVKAALSAPPRNCDVMDWRTAWAKWRTENHPQKPVGYSECYESTTMFMDWYMGTAEREGGSDGQ